MNYIYPCKAFLRKRLNMTKVIGLLRGNGSFEVHLARGVNFIENKQPDFQISGTVFFIERNQKIRGALFYIDIEVSNIYYSLKQVRYLINPLSLLFTSPTTINRLLERTWIIDFRNSMIKNITPFF